jgi:hypothetical protein
MRSVRITGVTGTSAWVPIDTYSPAQCNARVSGAGNGIEFTLDNVFDTSIAPIVIAATLIDQGAILPQGARAVRGTTMAPADILTVSQQGIM